MSNMINLIVTGENGKEFVCNLYDKIYTVSIVAKKQIVLDYDENLWKFYYDTKRKGYIDIYENDDKYKEESIGKLLKVESIVNGKSTVLYDIGNDDFDKRNIYLTSGGTVTDKTENKDDIGLPDIDGKAIWRNNE